MASRIINKLPPIIERLTSLTEHLPEAPTDPTEGEILAYIRTLTHSKDLISEKINRLESLDAEWTTFRSTENDETTYREFIAANNYYLLLEKAREYILNIDATMQDFQRILQSIYTPQCQHQIKKRIRGRSREELVEERAKIVNAMNAELSATIPDPVLNAELAPVLERIKDMASDVSKWEEADACKNSLKRLADISKLFVELARLATSIHESELLVTPLDEQFPNVANFGKRFFGDFTVKAKLVMVFAEISEYFFLNAVRLSTPMLRQLSYEIYRAQQLNNIGIILTAFAKASADFPIQQIQNYDKLCEIILDESEINDESTEVVETAIDELKSLNADATVCLSEAERVLIRQAVQGQVTTWYKCRNGHYFGIGECGRPMEKALCPDCKSEIGGENHVVMEGTTPTDF